MGYHPKSCIDSVIGRNVFLLLQCTNSIQKAEFCSCYLRWNESEAPHWAMGIRAVEIAFVEC